VHCSCSVSGNNSATLNVKLGKIINDMMSSLEKISVEVVEPSSLKLKRVTVSCSGSTIQYSRTPDSAYSYFLIFVSRFEFPGERISTIRSGAPRQPFLSIFFKSQIIQISG